MQYDNYCMPIIGTENTIERLCINEVNAGILCLQFSYYIKTHAICEWYNRKFAHLWPLLHAIFDAYANNKVIMLQEN